MRMCILLAVFQWSFVFGDTRCANVFASNRATHWRLALTNSGRGIRVKTTATREINIRKLQRQMTQELIETINTPEMRLLPESGVQVTVIQSFQNGKVPILGLSKIPASGRLGATLLLPVSGHCGLENAAAWAKTDTYKIYAKVADGPELLLASAKSRDIITFQEVSIPLQREKSTILTYHRSGSGGPGGYPSGRIIELKWKDESVRQ